MLRYTEYSVRMRKNADQKNSEYSKEDMMMDEAMFIFQYKKYKVHVPDKRLIWLLVLVFDLTDKTKSLRGKKINKSDFKHNWEIIWLYLHQIIWRKHCQSPIQLQLTKKLTLSVCFTFANRWVKTFLFIAEYNSKHQLMYWMEYCNFFLMQINKITFK